MVNPLHHLHMTLMDTQLLLRTVHPHSMDNHQLPLHMDHPHPLHQPMEKSPSSRLMTHRLMVSYQPQPLMVSCQKVLTKWTLCLQTLSSHLLMVTCTMVMFILNQFQHTLSNSMDRHIILPSLLMDRRHPNMENLQDTLSLLVMEQCQATLSRLWTL